MLYPNKLGGKMGKNKKPTMMQVKNVVNNMLMEIEYLKQAVSNLDFIVNYYIKYNDDSDKFKTYVEELSKKAKKEQDKNKEAK